MAGHQLPFVSVLVPFWLVATFVRMEGGTWKEAWEVWPGALCSGASFAVMQWFASRDRSLPSDDRRGLGRVFGRLHGAVPAFRLASKDAVPAASRSARRWRRPARTRRPRRSTRRSGSIRTPPARRPTPGRPGRSSSSAARIWGMPGVAGYLNNLFSGISFNTHAPWLDLRRLAVAAGLGHARAAQPGAAHAAGGAARRQARGGALHHQLVVGGRNGRVRRGAC